MSPLTVVFVCTGNTCRSPLAMTLARSMWPERTAFLSAGLQAAPGQPASPGALTVAEARSLGLQDHRSQSLDAALVEKADWLIGMTRSHVALLKTRLGRKDRVRIGLLGAANLDLSDLPIPEVEEVGDPFGGDLAVYESMAGQVARLLRAWQPTFGGTVGGGT